MEEGDGRKLVEIRGTVERITFRNEETLFTVMRVRPQDGGKERSAPPLLSAPTAPRQDPDLITAVGVVPLAEPGGSVSLTGSWTVDPRFGQQFRIDSAVPLLPASVEGIQRYLGSGMVKGIGKEFASRLVRKFGTDTLDVIENQPERLRRVPGIGPKRVERIVKAWEGQRAVRDVMLFLHSHGVTPAYAARIYRRYGRDAIARVKENPYVLASEVHGIGFLLADRIASRLGIDPDAPQRIRAGLLYTLDEASSEGHCFLPLPDLYQRASEILKVPVDGVEAQVQPLQQSGEITVVAGKEIGLSAPAVYPSRLEMAESRTASLLRRLMTHEAASVSVDVARALSWAQKKLRITFATAQSEAIEKALAHKVCVITGGPGTGKTTIVRAVASIIARKGATVALAAPTGRAAKRLSEATGREARTIHRLLRFSPREGGFLHDEDNPLPCDLLVVDEMSMVDITLMHHMLAAVPPQARLVLVGDADQLPSVGPGNVLRDILRSGVAPVTRLDEIFRQAGGSLIIRNAHRLNQGRMPLTEAADGETQDFYFIERTAPEDVLDAVLQVVTERIPKRWHLDPVRDVQVLTPMHRGVIGAKNLNEKLAQHLNAGARAVPGARGGHRIGDKVMQVRNNYDLEVYNGDIGRVVASDDEEKLLTVDFDGRRVQYDYADTDELIAAYAISIHKSQGSEFPAVVVIMSTSHYVMLQRNLLYTAVTRGKRLVVVVGTKKALGIALGNDRVRERHTALATRLRTC